MGHTLTIRLTRELAEWLEETAAGAGQSQGQIVRSPSKREAIPLLCPPSTSD